MWPTHANLVRPDGRKTSRLRQDCVGVGYFSGDTYQTRSDHVLSDHKDHSQGPTPGFALKEEYFT